MNAHSYPPMPANDRPIIDYARVRARLCTAASGWPIDIVDSTGSTNADLAAHLKTLRRDRDALATPLVRVAYEQTAGRGRQGRPWFARPGDALLCSVACVLPRPVGELAGLSIALGVALAQGLADATAGDLAAPPFATSATAAAARSAETAEAPAETSAATCRIAVKWPNDLLIATTHGSATAIAGKLGGILIETVWNTSDATAVVIGFGINVHAAETAAAEIAALRERSAVPASSLPPVPLASIWPQANLADTLAAALDALAIALPAFAASGLAPFRERWNALHAYAGRDVALLEHGVEIARGVARGIDASGQLLLDTPAGQQAIAAGDVSLREARPGAAQ
ncbi:biotin--[acetyl-CoA-carboxylase] ligase [Burkholderia sp. TSV86]|uniref:biotin--[acetyl-CoA-carboxylase] ligase n=1 Tax=Burkholderia sp. TSV86 TaxID=1385594 RepID=UPI0007588E50|nr:biotin--[acetyl-CoA-carboxylase] ligase [Burkholderia sp. TSV86]KVE38134.1 biotin--protein ligase [Burkholderia sp. TSV86]